LICSLIVSVAGSAIAHADTTYDLSIDPQPLKGALTAFAQQSGLQLVFYTDVTTGYRAPAIKGKLTREAALKKLLEGTELTFRQINSNTVEVSSLNAQKPTGAISPTNAFRLAQADAPALETAQPASEGPLLDEIVVTAQKRLERLQDVPVPVTAIDAQRLVNTNQLRLEDYYTRVPGLSFAAGYAGFPNISIRGLTTGEANNPTVGIVVDEVPYGSSTALGGGFLPPDLDPSDLARVEVLRGPQGTLYGASSLGGLLNYVTVDPSMEETTGRVQAGLSSVKNGDEIGYSVRASVNVPLSDTFAVRASGFTRIDPGYVDSPSFLLDPAHGKEGVNRGSVQGGRVSALWKPTDDLSLKLGAMLQDNTIDGSSSVHRAADLADLQQRALRGTGVHKNRSQAYSANLKARVGEVDLVSVSGYSVNKTTDVFDYTPLFGGFMQNGFPFPGFAGFGVAGAPYYEPWEAKKFSQELRLSMPIGERFDWLFGAFYTHEKARFDGTLPGVDPVTGATAGIALRNIQPTTFEEYAAFTDLTWKITDRFDIQFGGRQSQNRQTYSQLTTGPFALLFVGANPYSNPGVDSKDDAFTYLVTPRLKVSPELLIYGRFASGYRPGGPNTGNPTKGAPPSYGPDETQNYEIGIKGSVLDRALTFDASVYSIDWKDIQLLILDNAVGVAYNVNAARARSRGVELALESRPAAGLSIGASVTWNDAELTEDFPPSAVNAGAFGASGDRLPFSSRFSGSVSVDQSFAMSGNVDAFVGASVGYVGERFGIFTPSPARQSFPAYARVDVRLGATYESWTANAFVNNAADRRGVVGGGVGTANPIAFNYIQPRTIGLSVTRAF
jgi:outer membrane receptor protein involved in Fe transport